jgi:response regulator NasT
MALPETLTVLIAHSHEDTREMLAAHVQRLGGQVLGNCDSAQGLISRALAELPQLVITGVELQDGDGVAALVAISKAETIPAIIVTPQRSLAIVEQALHDHVMAYMMEPINFDELEPTIMLVLRRFEQFQELRQEVSELRQALSDRRLIERAKGILMERHQEGEEEAYKRLRRSATDQRMKMIDVAQQLLSEAG